MKVDGNEGISIEEESKVEGVVKGEWGEKRELLMKGNIKDGKKVEVLKDIG